MKKLIAAAVLSLAPVAANAATITYTGAGTAIPDVTTVTSTINVGDAVTITGLRFSAINLSHTFTNDLFATLSHAGNSVTWLNRTGGSADLGGTYNFTAGASNLLGTDGVTPGTYGTFTSLNVFNGTNSQGAWVLTIADQVGADIGNLGSWRLEIDYDATPSVPEPATWAMMMLGFGAMGASLRRRTKVRVAYAA